MKNALPFEWVGEIAMRGPHDEMPTNHSQPVDLLPPFEAGTLWREPDRRPSTIHNSVADKTPNRPSL
jgi:hypothetical protein